MSVSGKIAAVIGKLRWVRSVGKRLSCPSVSMLFKARHGRASRVHPCRAGASKSNELNDNIKEYQEFFGQMNKKEKKDLFKIIKNENNIEVKVKVKGCLASYEKVSIALETNLNNFKYCTRVYNPLTQTLYYLKPNQFIPGVVFTGVIHSAPPGNSERFFYVTELDSEPSVGGFHNDIELLVDKKIEDALYR